MATAPVISTILTKDVSVARAIGAVTSVTAECYRVPLAEPLVDASHGTHSHFELVLCRVETASGVTGTGYTYTGGSGGRAIAEFLRTDLAPLAMGMDAGDIGAIWTKVQSRLHYVGRGGLLSFALSALDIALWDAFCRAANRPLADLLCDAKPEPSVETYSGFIDLHLDGDALAAMAERALEQGFVSLKTKVGRARMEEDVARVELLRSVLGPDRQLMVDANYSYDVDRAVQFSRGVEHLDIGWFEEPISPDDFEGYAAIAERSSIPLAMGENLHIVEEFERAIRLSRLAIVQPDASNIGGITGWLMVADMADAAGLRVCSHGMHELHVSLLASRQKAGCLEWHSFPIDHYTKAPLVLEKGRAVTPRQVGIGVDFDASLLAPHRVS